jgi:tRNA threonylcarbamoyladenosine biosynthesis protein TsaE
MASVTRAPASWALDSSDEHTTRSLGQAIAQSLAAFESGPMLITLSGALGAGKTTLVRAILDALGHVGPVPSPSYTLLEQYEAGGWSVAHLDCYRLRDATELENLGVRDLLAGRRLLLVEWPENVAGGLPVADLAIEITVSGAVSGASRRSDLRARSKAGEALLSAIAQRMPAAS